MADKLKITLVKSTIGAVPKHVKTVEALGLKKLNKTVEMPDNAAVRGMIQQVRHLVKVEEIRNLIVRRCHDGFIKLKTGRRFKTQR